MLCLTAVFLSLATVGCVEVPPPGVTEPTSSEEVAVDKSDIRTEEIARMGWSGKLYRVYDDKEDVLCYVFHNNDSISSMHCRSQPTN